MQGIARALGVASLGLGAATLVRQRAPQERGGQLTSQVTSALLPLQFVSTAITPYTCLAGAMGAGLGILTGSRFAAASGLTGALLAGNYLRHVHGARADFAGAFGADWQARIPRRARQAMLPRHWTPRLPHAGDPSWTRDVAVASVPGTDRHLLADLWEPPIGVEPSGVAIVYVHGGAWYYMDKDVLTRPLFGQLTGMGHVVLDIAHRDCPEVDLVGMVGDAQRAVAWMKAHAREFGAVPERVVLMGGSSGGHVALLAGLAANHPDLTPADLGEVDLSVAGVVSWYGVVDLRAYAEHTAGQRAARQAPSPAPEAPGPTLDRVLTRVLGRTLTADQMPPTPPHRQMMSDMLGGLPDEVPHMYDLTSAITHVTAGSPPVLQLIGTYDFVVPLESVRDLHRALIASGIPAVCVEFPRTDHAFDLMYPPMAGPAARVALHDVEAFIELACATAPDPTSPAPEPRIVAARHETDCR